MKRPKTGIFSGSFNPIHIGHLALANYLCEFEGLDELWFLVSPQNPLKQESDLWSDELRLKLVQLSIEGYPKFHASDVEFHLPRPSYTIDTLDALKAAHPDREFIFIIGSDNWHLFHRWYESKRIISENQLLVYPRPGFDTNKNELPQTVRLVNSPSFEISSTFIRQALNEGKDVRYFLHPAAYKYLMRCPNHYFSFNRRKVISNTSAGAPIRISLFDVPIPLVTINGTFAELYFKPVKKRAP